MQRLHHERCLEALERELELFRDYAKLPLDALTTPIDPCPGWTVADVLGHLSSIERWVMINISSGANDEPPWPSDPAAAVAWFTEGVDAFLDLLRSTPVDAPAWTLDPADRRAGFWRRRQLHEHTVHRVDVQRALRRSAGVDPVIAADGVAEVIDVMFPRQLRLGRVEPATVPPVRLRATDVDDQWLLSGDSSADPVAEVSGTAEQLDLLLWRRLSPDQVTVTGDRRSAAAALTVAITP